MPAHRIVALLGAGAGVGVVVLALTACGGDGDGPAPVVGVGGGGGGAVDVVAHDIGFDEDRYEADAGTVDFDYRNDGALQHALLVEGVDGFRLDVAARGDTDEGSVELDAGTYTIYCDVPGHREAGMQATLEVG